jgi:hypothetical protein
MNWGLKYDCMPASKNRLSSGMMNPVSENSGPLRSLPDFSAALECPFKLKGVLGIFQLYSQTVYVGKPLMKWLHKIKNPQITCTMNN